MMAYMCIKQQKECDGCGACQEPLAPCPECGSPMVKRHGKYGDFYGCSNYPKCRHTEPITEEGKDGDAKPSPYPCPRCKKGTFQKRTGPYGVFWVCSGETCNTKCADVDGVPSLYAKS